MNRRMFIGGAIGTGALLSLPSLGIIAAKPSLKSKKENASRMITFDEAKENEGKRQEYLDQQNLLLKDPAVKRIIYSDSWDFRIEIVRDMISAGDSAEGALASMDSLLKNMKETKSWVFALLNFSTMGKTGNSNIYVLQGAFDADEASLLVGIARKRFLAGYNKDGMQIGSLNINHSNFRKYSQRLRNNILAACDIAHEIKELHKRGTGWEIIRSKWKKLTAMHLNIIVVRESELTDDNKALINEYVKAVYNPAKAIYEKYLPTSNSQGVPV